MTYFPMFVSLQEKPCLVIGGGAVAARKCRGLLAFGAQVTVIAEKLSGLEGPEELRGGKETCGLHKIKRSFRDEDITGRDWTLVIAATDDRKVNGRAAALCRERQIPVNVADCKEECTFFFPAYCMEGNVAAGVTTSGTAPGLASALRRRLEGALPRWIEEIGKEAEGNG